MSESQKMVGLVTLYCVDDIGYRDFEICYQI